jgi:hypothetical protein
MRFVQKSNFEVHDEALSFLQLTAKDYEDYDLPTFGPKHIKLVKNVSLGRGSQLLR